ncbi:hypothetical protein GIB67_007627 [Kingdonia uniflora]|uniref:RING-type domain-containing protein n=1 Tax=Kingdonia uniflora TaxID=39325 RepID=A0A7J7N1G9_9MAGN|nr:hypothetical protein GIB67_007627 [Kingdonia uniflora]
MGFDNECILNIQSLAGEYFCPVCRLLVYPNEAIQSQCTHLYCKPCLTYVVSTTRACPYDGYLVTEADSKPLLESNKALAETIGKIAVHCLFHRSGCSWQGQFSECTAHCAGCQFGNSPVVCNRCGTQIVHRQVQEHAQTCPGVQPQMQPAEGAQDATTAPGAAVVTEQTQATSQAGAPTSQVPAQVTAAPPSTQVQTQSNTISLPQAAAQGLGVPTQEQWYQQQQQYQQYYQQYPGHDPYQQQYQQYAPYQQQAPLQYQQQLQTHPLQGQPQPQVYMQPQPQPQAQAPTQLQPQPQPPVQAHVNPQQQMQPSGPPQPQMPVQTQPLPQGQQHPQLYAQVHPHPQQVQSHSQQRPPVPQHQQPHPQMQHPQALPHPPPHSQPLLLAQPQLHQQPQNQNYPQMQTQSYPQPNLQGQNQPGSAVTGHNSYPQPQPLQQMAPGAPQHPMHLHPQQPGAPHQPPLQTLQSQGQYTTQHIPSQMRPPHSGVPMQQQPAMVPPQGAQQHPLVHQPGQPIHQYPPQQQPTSQHPQSFPGQTPGIVHGQGHFVQPQLRPPGPPVSSQLPHARPHLQQNVPVAHGMQPHQSQNHVGRPAMAHQPFPTGPPQSKLMQATANQTCPPNMNVRSQSSSEQQPIYVHQSPHPQSSGGPQPGAMEMSTLPATLKSEVEVDASFHKTDTKDVNDLRDLKIPSEMDLQSSEAKSVNKEDEKSNIKDVSESKEALGNDTVSIEQKDGSEEPVIKQIVKEGENGQSELSTGEKSLQEDKEIQGDPNRKNLLPQQTSILDANGQNLTSQGQVPWSERNNMHAPPPNLASNHEIMLSQPGYHERNWPQPQVPRQGPGHLQGNSYRPPMHMQEGSHGQPLVADQILPLPPQMQGTGYPPFQMRPQGPNSLGSLPPGQSSVMPEHIQPLLSKQPYGSFHPEAAPPGGFIGPGPSSFGRGPPGPFGPSRGGFEPNAPHSHYNQGHVPPHNAPPVGGPPVGGPPHGAFDSQGGKVAWRNGASDTEMFPNKRPSYFDGSVERHPFGQPSNIESNISRIGGGPGKGLQEERFKPFAVDRYKHLPEEGFHSLHEGRFKPFPNEQSRRIIDRRDFEEDLKQFPRPAHLDAEHGVKFENYFSSSRPLDRAPHGPFNNDIGPKLDGGASRLLPPYRPGGLRPTGLHDDSMGRNVDPLAVHPDFIRSTMDSGRHRGEGLPSLRSPGREYPGIPSNRFGRSEDIDGRESRLFGEHFHENRFSLPNHLRRGDHDGPGNLRIGEQMRSSPRDFGGPDIPLSHMRSGEPGGSHNLPSHLRWGEQVGFGAFPNHLRVGDHGRHGNMSSNLRIGEPIGGNLPGHGRKGEPGFRSSFSNRGFPSEGGPFNPGDGESFDQSRKRKHGSTGRCLICKIDCKTVEGLDVHSQTKEHQKMAMDMVSIIKKDNAKKQKVSSEDHVSNEDENKTGKDGIESSENDV